MYSNGVICRHCSSCIFYSNPEGLSVFCNSCDPASHLSWVSHYDYVSNPSLASAYDTPCDHYINFMDHLSDLRKLFDGGVK